jgi:hypothetical protein
VTASAAGKWASFCCECSHQSRRAGNFYPFKFATHPCSMCFYRRPNKVCICSTFPETPLATRGSVIVLQHPHEQRYCFHYSSSVHALHGCLATLSLDAEGQSKAWASSQERALVQSCAVHPCRRRLATVPLLSKLLQDCRVLVSRQLPVRITETNRTQIVLLDLHNRKFGPYLITINRILILATRRAGRASAHWPMQRASGPCSLSATLLCYGTVSSHVLAGAQVPRH